MCAPFCSAGKGERRISNLNKTREQLAELFLQALSEDKLPWQQPWVNTAPGMFDACNAVSGKRYHGVNALRLWIESIKMEYTDPHWCTYRQAQENGWQVRRGESGTPVEFWKVYDTKAKKSLDFAEYHRIVDADPDRVDDFKIYAKTFTVFNGCQMDGFPLAEQGEHIPPEYKDELLAEFAENYLAAEHIQLIQGGFAAYSFQADYLKMPEKETFHSELDYYSTLFHEISHSTGHESRLNRLLASDKHSEEYAAEELRAEIGSAFILNAAGCDVPESITENNKAYIQSWAQSVKDKPESLFAAIKDAGAICDFVAERGQLPALLERYSPDQGILDDFAPDAFDAGLPPEESAEAMAM